MYPLMMNDMLGTRFKMVTGYPGSGQLNLAFERGEVDSKRDVGRVLLGLDQGQLPLAEFQECPGLALVEHLGPEPLNVEPCRCGHVVGLNRDVVKFVHGRDS